MQEREGMNTELEQAVAKMIEAIQDEGALPAYQRRMMKAHKEEWPLLWEAIDNVIDVATKEACKECKRNYHDLCENPRPRGNNWGIRPNELIQDWQIRMQSIPLDCCCIYHYQLPAWKQPGETNADETSTGN